MFESIAHSVLGDHMAGMSWDPPIGETGYARLKHRRPYATKDGYLCVLVYNDKQWRAFLEAVGRVDLLQDPRFFPHAARARHIGEIYDFLDGLLRTRTTAQWMERQHHRTRTWTRSQSSARGRSSCRPPTSTRTRSSRPAS